MNKLKKNNHSFKGLRDQFSSRMIKNFSKSRKPKKNRKYLNLKSYKVFVGKLYFDYLF